MNGQFSGTAMYLTHILPGSGHLERAKSLSKKAKLRLQWMDYYQRHGNVALTCRHFGIARKTFYHWYKHYNPRCLTTLESHSTAPVRTRKGQRKLTTTQRLRVLNLRQEHIRYGKMKLRVLYEQRYAESISAWQIQRVIEDKQLYWHPEKTRRAANKRKQAQLKKRITELKKEHCQNFLFCLDGIVLYFLNTKRYIFTAIDPHTKLAYARMYPSKASKHTTDFLNRLMYLVDHQIKNLQTDNGSEFEGLFADAIQKLNLTRYYSRVRTPTDNSAIERFNRTIQEEFTDLGHLTDNVPGFNKDLTDWLIEYSYHRPHQSLDYATPLAFIENTYQVLPMYSSRTRR